jgi:hypothetical protein
MLHCRYFAGHIHRGAAHIQDFLEGIWVDVKEQKSSQRGPSFVGYKNGLAGHILPAGRKLEIPALQLTPVLLVTSGVWKNFLKFSNSNSLVFRNSIVFYWVTRSH